MNPSDQYYVHYRLKNYREYGINRDMSGGVDAARVFASQKLYINNMVDRNKQFNVEQIQNKLNKNYNLIHDENFSNPKQSKEKEVLEYFINKFKEDLSNSGKAVSIDRTTLSVFINDGLSQNAYREIEKKLENSEKQLITIKNNELGSGKKMINTTTINSRVQALLKVREVLVAEMSSGPSDYTELISLISNIEQRWNELSKDLSGLVPKTSKGLGGSKNGLIAQINQAISKIRLQQASNESGKLAELVSAVIMNMNTLLTAQAIKESGDILYDSLIKNPKLYSKGSFLNIELTAPQRKNSKTSGTVNNSKLAQIKLPGSGITVTIDSKHQSKQGKIDFTFTDDKTNEVVGVSHKSYTINNKTEIHINSGSDLSLMTQQYPQFEAHYLNVMAAHKDSGAMDLSSLRQLAKQAMKYTVLGYSLLGGFVTDKGIMDKADVLVIHQKGAGYRAFSMTSILDQAMNNVDSYMKLENELREDLNNDFVQVFQRTGRRQASIIRVNNLLTQLKTMSASASLKASALGY